jgi:putative membrane protein
MRGDAVRATLADMSRTTLVQLAIQFVIYAVSVLLAAKLVRGIKVRSFGSALVFAVVIAILDVLLWKLLVLLTLPLVAITLGIFILVINAFLFKLADKLVSGVSIERFSSAFWGALITAIINWALTWAVHRLL